MEATTVTNADGTFSPAIDWVKEDGVRERWVERNMCMKNEDVAARRAVQHIRTLQHSMTRMLIEGHYALLTF